MKIDLTPRRVGVNFNRLTIDDSRDVLILHERVQLPVYYLPERDVRKDSTLLQKLQSLGKLAI